MLYARSGLGKTSLLLAGMFPILRERHLNPILVRILSTPVLDLRNAIAGVLGKPCSTDTADLDDLVVSACQSGDVVLVFDQFEEFFINTRNRPTTRREFIQLVATLVHRSHGDVRVTFSLREEYLAELDEFHDAFPDMLTNQYRLHSLTAFGARQAIVAPLLAAGIQFDQRVVVRLVDMLAEVDFDPVLLQIACGEVYREAMNREAGASLTEADLDKVGGIQGLFERYLDNAIARVPHGQLLLCRAMLDALTTPEETKRAVPFEALLRNDDFQASLEEIQSVLDCLKDQMLVRPDLRGEQLFYELSHDRLAPSVVKWFKRDADFAQFRDARDLIADATRRASFPDKLETLIGAAQIDKLIGPYRQRLRLTDDQRALMFWSAVYSRTGDVGFWATLFGTDRACRALLLLLAHASAEARLGAATASEQLASDMPDVKHACLIAALEDQDRAVRLAAARALARLAGDDEILALESALGSRPTRSRALDVLATFVEMSGPIDRFGRIWRVWARSRARRRVLNLHRERIVARGNRGAIVGVAAAAGWSATIGAVLACLTVWMRGEIAWSTRVFVVASIGAASAAALAALCGWVIGRFGAARAAATGVEGAWMLVTGLFALVVGLVSFLMSLGNPYLMRLSSTWLLGPVVLFLVAGVSVRLFRPAIWPPDITTRRERAGWALMFGLPVAVPLSVLGFFAGDRSELIWLATAMLSAAPTIVALVLSETADAFPIGMFPRPAPRARLVTRAILLLSAVAAPVLFMRLAGVDSIPFLAKTFEIAPDIQVPLPLRTGQVDSVYFALQSTGDQTPWLEAESPPSVDVKSASGSVLDSSSTHRAESRVQILYVPQGRYRLAAVSRNAPGGELALRLRTLPLLDEKIPVQLSEENWSPHVLRIDEIAIEDKTQRRVWRALVRGRVTEGQHAPGGSVRVLLLAGAAKGGGEIVQQLPNEATAAERRVTYPLPSALDSIDFPLSASTADSNRPELKSIPIGPDGSFRMVLTYRPPPGRQESTSSAPQAQPLRAGQPLDIPVLLAIRGPDFRERLLKNEKPGALLARLKADPATWNERSELEEFGRFLSKARRYDESIELHRRIVQLESNADTLNGLAWELVISGRGAEALEPAREAAKLSGRKSAYILDTLAHAEHTAGNLRAAVLAWDETIQLDPAYYQPPSDDFCVSDLKLLEEARRAIALGR